MEKINVDGRILLFEDYYGSFGIAWSVFYEGIETYEPWYNFLLRRKVVKQKPRRIFSAMSPNDPFYSKDELRRRILEELQKFDRINNRQIEIENKNYL